MAHDESLIERLYHAARACPAGERHAFLASACGGDTRLYAEIASLLAQDVSHPGPLDDLAMDVAVAAILVDRGALLSIGQRIGTCEVVAPIDAGSVGRVYRARDTVLHRDVAIKVVSSAVVGDSTSLARIEREARVLASLNHPNIASIYGFEVVDDFAALILELIKGETLARRIARSPFGVGPALEIARQLCDGLEAAHSQGIVHRDLKPANVMITVDDLVKLLDFGLAKVGQPYADGDPLSLTGPPGTVAGTPAYMSPEQARGQTLDHRTDIWAFGCVFYEMLSGRQAFDAQTVPDTLVAVLEREPAWRALPDDLPPGIRRLLERCLRKDPADRLRHIGDARLEIEDALRVTGQTVIAAERRDWTRALRWTAIAAAVILAAIGGRHVGSRLTGEETPAVTHSLLALQPFDLRTTADTGGKSPAIRPDRTAVALSPDGRTLVWQARDGQGTRLYRRSLERPEVTPIEGTEGADSPFFSPDGSSLGFRVAGELKRVLLDGGPATRIAALTRRLGPEGSALPARLVGASWADDRIVFATGAGTGGRLWQVPASGGEPQLVAEPGDTQWGYRLPQILPGSDAVLLTVVNTPFWWRDAQIAVRSLSTGKQQILLEDAADARYVTTGHILFMRGSTLMAVRFDVKRLEVTGSPVALVENVMHSSNSENIQRDSGAGQFAVASNGTLVYVTGGVIPQPRRRLVWIDRNGAVEPLPLAVDAYYQPRLSPNGRQIVAFTSELGVPRIWGIDPLSGARTPVTTVDERGTYNVWTPDGKRIVFSRLPESKLYWKSADGTGRAEVLFQRDGVSRRDLRELIPASWHKDGRRLAILETRRDTEEDILVADTADLSLEPNLLARSAGRDFYPEFSPDGEWVAYASNESGLGQVYVQRYPGPGPRVIVSTSGGTSPVWRRDGKELFYVVPVLTPDGQLNRDPEAFGRRVVAASLDLSSPGAKVTITRELFRETATRRFTNTIPTRGYDVTADGSRFLMVQELGTLPEPAPELVLVQQWFTELQRLVPN